MSDRNFYRTELIAENLRNAEQRIDQACRISGRKDTSIPNSVTLIVVTKTYPETDVQILCDLGVRNVGENRDQEAKPKAAHSPSDLIWHMIGQIQRNKINSIVSWADAVHTCDRAEIVEPLSRAALAHSKLLGVFIQVNLDPSAPENRGGIQPDGMLALAESIAAEPALKLQGLMAVAPHPSTGIEADASFEQLAKLSQTLSSQFPGATDISAGMSNDLEEAIAHGATHVRLGSAILGDRAGVQ